MVTKPKILWVGDAWNKTGFEFVSRGFLTELQRLGWDVAQLGIGHFGDPHDYPWRVYPAVAGGDHLGIGRLAELTDREKPDVVMLLNDSWACTEYFKRLPLPKQCPPIVVYPPVDAPHQPAAKTFNQVVSHVICPTQFGVDEIKAGGWGGPSSVVHYGIDVSLYAPGMSRLEARQKLGFPEVLQKAFIVGNVNRNAPRKRLDLTMMAFVEMRRELIGVSGPEPFLLLHCDPKDSWGWDVVDMARYFGIAKNVILSFRDDGYVPFDKLRLVYRAIDINISTTVGEGWGLTTAEAMASGTLNVVPRYSALGEWADGGVVFYGIAGTQINTGQVNTVWAIPDWKELASKLSFLYRGHSFRTELAQRGLEHIRQSKFSWQAVGEEMDKVLREVIA